MSPNELAEVNLQIEDLHKRGSMVPSASPHGAPVLFVKKKDGSIRMCIDHRTLDRETVKQMYPTPRIDDILNKLQGAKGFTSFDIQSGPPYRTKVFHRISQVIEGKHQGTNAVEQAQA